MSDRTPIQKRNAHLALAAAVAAGLATSLVSTTAVRAVPPTIDGTRDAGYGAPFAVQTVNSGFNGAGLHQSQLDAGYAHIENGKLYLFLAGNLESNFNKMVIFFDTRAGGQNQMLGNNPDVDFNNLNNRYVGMTFDAGFSPDYTLFYSRDAANVFLNFSELNTGGGGFGAHLGQVATPNPSQQGSGTVGGTGGSPTVEFGYSDANVAGVGNGSAAADQTAAAAVTTGSELSIDLSQIGATENFTMMIGINGSSHDFWSNQFLPGLTPPQGNLGSDGLGNFVPPGSVSAVNFETQVAGSQFLQINYHAPLSHWNNAGSGNWTELAKWTNPDGVPNAPDARAFLDNTVVSGAPRTVTLDTNVSLQQLTFDSAGGYTIAPSGGNVLTIKGNPATPAINVISGSHTIGAPLTLGATTNVTVATGSALTVTGNLTATDQTIVKHGGGTATFNNLRANGVSAQAGVIAVAPNGGDAGASKLNFIDVNTGAGAAIDLTDNDLVVGGGTSKTDVEILVAAARNGGAWDLGGLTSSTARNNGAANTTLGVLSGAEYTFFNPSAGGVFSGQSYADTDTLVKYTWNGDANFSGQVNFDDYVLIDVGFNLANTGWANGDFNYSGSVNFDDYVLIDVSFNTQSGTLARAAAYLTGEDRSTTGMNDPALLEVIEHFGQFGAPYASALLAAVPEPTALALLGVSALAGMSRRRRRSET